MVHDNDIKKWNNLWPNAISDYKLEAETGRPNYYSTNKEKQVCSQKFKVILDQLYSTTEQDSFDPWQERSQEFRKGGGPN